ncbi:hypothetical protein Ahy_B03g062641 [Arachis hypogaea]|uniref:Uncharacterized protein n=1 Tax=Arachis hypogaea TaxID=3818 RepID=A0A444ZV07_ARAHY|nr:hypothetical protein Ahy_B03g062641 [Arachis hypogaea]
MTKQWNDTVDRWIKYLHAANIINTWNAVSNVVPVIGAFVADACLGKFRTIAFASLASLTGLIMLFNQTLLVYLPDTVSWTLGRYGLPVLFMSIIVFVSGARKGKPDWLHSDINKGRWEYFYFIIAGFIMLNTCYFVFCARRYCLMK